MKLVLFLITFISSSISMFAQEENGWSLNAMGYGGLGVEFQLNVQYKFNRFSLGTGISYLVSQLENDREPVYPVTMVNNNKERYTFRHVNLPVNMGYHILVGRKFELIPSAGMSCSYNLAAKYMAWQNHYENLYERTLSQGEFDHNYKQLSLWTNLNLQLEYRITERIGILTGIEFKYMVTSINKQPQSGAAKQHSYIAAGGFGIQYRFR